MTANVTIEMRGRTTCCACRRRRLRYRPTTEMFAALKQEVPPEARGGCGGAQCRQPGRRRSWPAAAARWRPGNREPAAPTPVRRLRPRARRRVRRRRPERRRRVSPGSIGGRRSRGWERQGRRRRQRNGGGPAAEQRRPKPGGGDNPVPRRSAADGDCDPNMTPEERRKRMEERMAKMTPGERAEFEERMAAAARAVGRRPAAGGNGQGGNGRGRATAAATQNSGAAAAGATPTSHRPTREREIRQLTMQPDAGATTIDSLFGPMPTVETRGRVWLWIDKRLKPVTLRLGISDGTNTEVLDASELQAGRKS